MREANHASMARRERAGRHDPLRRYPSLSNRLLLSFDNAKVRL